MKIFNKIKKRMVLISEGYRFQDKVSVFLWLLLSLFGVRLFKDILIKNEDGLFICRKNSQDLWMVSPYGESELRKYFKLDGGTFIDVGANIGKYSIMLGNKFKNYEKIIAIEPEKKSYLFLLKNLRLNKIKRVIPINVACFYKNTNIKIYTAEDSNLGAHSIYKRSKKYTEVPALKLDTIIRRNKIKKIDLIKIDVEGAEADVLMGALKTLKKYHPKIIFEAWDLKHLKKVREILIPLKYKIKKIADENYLAN